MQLRSGKPILKSGKSPSPKRLSFSEPLVESVHEYSYDMPTWTWLEKAIKQKEVVGIMRLLSGAQKKVDEAEKKAEDAERRINEMRLELQTIKYQQARGLDINPSSSKDAATAR
ncbi:hypothetical protein AAVH_23863 [Aphelenchoides avenae]|nr:hypothetical protein AAVH_23863 [Aphelenchus avenae]